MIKKANFIICYDISDEKRLAKIAKITEKEAFRIQRSIYLYPDATIDELSRLVKKIIDKIDRNKDDVRIYKISKGSIALGKAVDIDNFDIFLQ